MVGKKAKHTSHCRREEERETDVTQDETEVAGWCVNVLTAVSKYVTCLLVTLHEPQTQGLSLLSNQMFFFLSSPMGQPLHQNQETPAEHQG